MGREITVLKLGGSLLTDKTQPYHVREDVIGAVSREIRECLDAGLMECLVLVHGVGSYGHPPVLEHKLHKGFLDPEQLLPLSKTQEIVGEFRHIIVKSLQAAEIPVCLMYPSSMFTADKMQMVDYFLEPLKQFLSLGMVPLLGGDILVDSKMGWSVGSGDQMAVVIAKELGAKRIIFASDVSGIYDSDPKVNPDAQLIKEVNLNNLDEVFERMGKSGTVDASGAMRGKLMSISPAKGLIEKGLEVSIMSMMEPGRLKSLLAGESVPSTRVVVK